jgi:hypothetical protein
VLRDYPTVQWRAWLEIRVRNSSPVLQTSRLAGLNRFRIAVLSTVLLRSWVLAQFCCDQSAVAMRLFAGLTSAQLALLSRLGTTSRTMDSEYLFWAEFSFHDGEILPQTHVQKWSILNISGNYLQGSVVVPGAIPACSTGSYPTGSSHGSERIGTRSYFPKCIKVNSHWTTRVMVEAW